MERLAGENADSIRPQGEETYMPPYGYSDHQDHHRNFIASVRSRKPVWRTTRQPEGESSSLRFDLQLDGQWHDYVLPVGKNPRWRGTITTSCGFV